MDMYNVAAEIVLYCFYVNVMWNRMKVNLWISSNNTYLEANKRSIKVLFSIWSSTKFKLKITSRTIRLKLDSLKWTRLTYNLLYCLAWHYIRPNTGQLLIVSYFPVMKRDGRPNTNNFEDATVNWPLMWK